MTYGNLALATGTSACREVPAAGYHGERVVGRDRLDRARPTRVDSPPSSGRGGALPGPGAVVELSPREQAVRRADRQALALCATRLMLSVRLTSVAAAMVESSAWNAFGFARVGDFARERFGRSGRWLRDLAALHDSMRALPGLDAALTGADGSRPIGRVAALLVGRIASPMSVQDWIALARRASVRELRDAVRRSRAAGSDQPPHAGDTEEVNNPSPHRSDRDRSGMGDPEPSGVGNPEPPGARDPEPPGIGADDHDPADRSLVRIAVPPSVRAAFDEAVDLYRVVEGTEATVTSFVESLVAESAAGGAPPDVDRAPIHPGPNLALVETALAHSTNRWSHLSPGPNLTRALSSARDTLRRAAEITKRSGGSGPSDLVAQMRQLIELENDIETRLGTLLAGMTEDQAWSRLRFSGVGHYAEERLGLSRTAAEDRVRAARALRRYPRLRREYQAGGLGLEAVLVVARILDRAPPGAPQPTDEQAWVARALEATVKRLRDDARLIGRRLGASAEEAVGPAHRPSSDAEWHAALWREPGTSRRRILRMGLLATGLGAEPGTDADTLPLPTPDVLRLRLPADLAAQFVATIEAYRRRRADEAGSVPLDQPWPEDENSPPLPSLLAARMFSTRSRRIPAWVGLLAIIEDFVLTWDRDMRPGHRSRDRVFVRDGWRCAAPGCSSRRNLEDHHVVYRSRGGGDGVANRLCLCRFHHQRGEHGGLASCSGEAPLDITWRLGRRDLAVWYRNERRIEQPGVPASL